MRAQVAWLPDRQRLHLHDGPIDLIVQAFGGPAEINAAYDAAINRFGSVLDELCDELAVLRQPAHCDTHSPDGPVARRMMEAVRPFAEKFITPMAAVAGSVAEEILMYMTGAASLRRGYVNNGGDIALHLAAGERFKVGMVGRPDHPSLFGTAVIEWDQAVRGIATSGWRGRSFSLGIADAVTVLAANAAIADAAATMIANAVDLPGHANIIRVPAIDLAPDSDLGERRVTQLVGDLSDDEIDCALNSGLGEAEEIASRELIHSAALCLRGRTRVMQPVRRFANA